MHHKTTRTLPYEDLLVGCVALVALAVCAFALYGVPTSTENRGVSYTEFVRTPAVPPAPLPQPIIREHRVAELPLQIPASKLVIVPTTCTPDAEAELERLLALCQG